MNPFPSITVKTLRTAFWHFRRGGIPQVRTWYTRQKLRQTESNADALSLRTTPRQCRYRPKDPYETAAAGKQEQDYTVVDFTPATLPQRPPRASELNVAVILDDFSQLAWSYEFNTIQITPQNWPHILAATSIDMLLVESAWQGNQGAWRYHLTGPSAPSPALISLLEHCQKAQIPTIFWNKEDPPHFEDFLATARLFDQVFTTDETLIPRYREELGHDRIAVLPFAAQDAVHNPIRPRRGHQERDVAFAGMYFAHKFPERREQMDLLLGGALDVSDRMTYGLEIFSRFLGENDRYQFPGKLARRVVGSLTYDKMLTAYKAYKVFLNVNSVVTSPSMCARRVFEITASGTPVVSTPSAALPTFFTGQQVPLATSRESAGHIVRALVRSPELRDRTVHCAQRTIWQRHTYSHRAHQVLTAADLGDRAMPLELPTVSALVSTNRPHQLNHLLGSVARQSGVELQLVLVSHGFELDKAATVAQAHELGIADVHVIHMPSDTSLGECLNRAVEAADGDVLTKMDDDDVYGTHYLMDLLYALRWSGATLVGKQAHYMYLADHDATLLRFRDKEHRWTDLVMGPTLTALRDVFRTHPFTPVSRGEDTQFLRAITADGGSIYSADRFNFTQMRSGLRGGHAWSADDRELLATGDVEYFGYHETHINI
ncbi:glycosyltransferase family protein [Devriesea agamarum]|uniref:glycosyltransferase family protein n=1 Tax=Devriesea agamarum TaxID=472569 RepID=UPI00071C53A0|nr:glycosyltransferase [Devriesea agamarum]